MGADGGLMGTGTTLGVRLVSAVLTAAIYLGYFSYLESSRGQTLGKMVMKLRTVSPTGGNPTLAEAVRRNIFTGFGVLAFIPFLGFLAGLAQLIAIIMIAVGISKDTVNRQAWHDIFAGGTQVRKQG
jgi:uncharacterized RDD family membrane protein YckC